MASELCCAAMTRKLLPLVLGVVAAHGAALWLLQASWLRPPVALPMPDQILIKLLAPAAPHIVAPPPTTARPAAAKPPRTQAPAPRPAAAVPSLTGTTLKAAPGNLSHARSPPPPTPYTGEGSEVSRGPTFALTAAEPIPSASPAHDGAPPPSGAAPVFGLAEAGGGAALTAPLTVAPRLELPSGAAAYLQNPKPPYPALSRRLGEQGQVVLRVLIGVDGQAHAAEIDQSSGFARLDQAALGTVLRWRYLPGRHAGVAQAMWFKVPISFVLQ